MLQTLSPQQPVLSEERGQTFDLAFFVALLKRRIFYFAIPFIVVVMIGTTVVAIQRPIYRAEGKILVESPEIPSDLVRPTVVELADARIQVIQQRIMTRDSLLEVVNKYKLFPRERTWMSGTELLDLMRDRMEIKPVALETQRSNNPSIAFTLSFDYEVPDLARRVANDFLTLILSEDASSRTNSAAETTKFLEREVKRLDAEHDTVISQIEAVKRRPPAPEETASEEVKTKTKTLAELEATLVQKSSVYSDQHPEVKNLKKRIAAVKRAIATAPQVTRVADGAPSDDAVSAAVLERQEANIARSLDETNRKLTAARLGESMERGQQAERLEVIEHPSQPQKPVRPKRSKWFAAAFALALLIGAGSAGAAEMLDHRIRGSGDLTAIIDRSLIVALPYLATPGEERRKRRSFILVCTALVAAFACAIGVAVFLGFTVDFSWFDHSGIDVLTRLLK